MVKKAFPAFIVRASLRRATGTIRHSAQIYVAAEIARDVSMLSSPDAIWQRAVQLITERFGFYHAGIFIVDSAGEMAILRAAAGTEGSQALVKSTYQMQVGGVGIVGYVTSTGNHYLANDVRQDKNHHINPYLPDTRAELSVPLQVAGRTMGVLDVQSKQVNAFDASDIKTLQILADLLAIAIENSHLHQALREQNALLEQKVAERTQALETTNKQMSVILNSITEGLIYTENDHPLFINPAYTRLLGYDIDNYPGVNAILISHGQSVESVRSLMRKVQDSVAKQGLWQGELRLHCADGREIDALVSFIPIEGEGIEKGLSIVRDISHEKALEEGKMRLVDYASHELRTPIANLKTRLFLLDKQPHKFREHFQVLQSVTTRMQRIVDDLLTLSRLQRGHITFEPSLLTMQEIVLEVYNLFRFDAELKGLKLILEMSEAPIMAYIDRDRIVQVLTNLISNAVKYTLQGTVTIRLSQVDKLIQLEVQDTGVGIPEHAVKFIFQPFYRADNVTESGHGLGLNVTKQIVEMHGGSIYFISQQNQGSTFSITLPVHISSVSS